MDEEDLMNATRLLLHARPAVVTTEPPTSEMFLSAMEARLDGLEGIGVPVSDGRPGVVGVEEMASLLGKSVHAVRDAARRGDIPGRKVGRRWTFVRERVIDYLAQADEGEQDGRRERNEERGVPPRRSLVAADPIQGPGREEQAIPPFDWSADDA